MPSAKNWFAKPNLAAPSMKLSVTHESHYLYAQSVSLSPHHIYLRPRQNSSQRLERFEIKVSSGAVLSNIIDPLDNDFINAWFPEKTDRIDIHTEFEIETLNSNPFNFLLSGNAVTFPFDYEPSVRAPLAPYLVLPDATSQAEIKSWLAREFPSPPRDTTEFLGELIQLIFKTITYRRREELGFQTSVETIHQSSGTCRDFAVLFVDICRVLGIAARFVSGYLYTPPSDEPDVATNSMHAWTEIYLPGSGWKGLDPTQGVWSDDCYIPVAHGAQAQSVNPVQGSYYSKQTVTSKLESSVIVTRLDS